MSIFSRLFDGLTGTSSEIEQPSLDHEVVSGRELDNYFGPVTPNFPEEAVGLDPNWVPRGMSSIVSPETPFEMKNRDLASSVQYAGFNTILTPPSAITYWRDYGFDTQTLSKTSPVKLLELLTDLSPDMSRALWDFLRFTNPGYEIKAYIPGTARPDTKSQKVLDDFLGVLGDRHGTLDLLFGKLFMGAFLRGAFLGELVVAADGRTPLTIATPDPAIIRFRKIYDKELGSIFEMGQVTSISAFDPLFNKDKIIYLPIDPHPGNPYGRPLGNPAVFALIFLISMMNDIRRVVSQQGYPRIDLEIDLAALASIMPPEAAQDPQTFNRWVSSAIADVKNTYAKLQPDAAFVHTSIVKIHSNVGVLDVNSLGMVGSIIDKLELMAMRALKSMPLLMGNTSGISEANANRQWEIFVAGIKSLQHSCDNMVARLLQMALQAQGIATHVEVRFAELRTSELLRDEMTHQLKISNALSEYLLGVTDYETMSVKITGKLPPKGNTEPLWVPKNFIPFGAANTTKAETATPGSALPAQAGGDVAATGTTPATSKKGKANPTKKSMEDDEDGVDEQDMATRIAGIIEEQMALFRTNNSGLGEDPFARAIKDAAGITTPAQENDVKEQ